MALIVAVGFVAFFPYLLLVFLFVLPHDGVVRLCLSASVISTSLEPIAQISFLFGHGVWFMAELRSAMFSEDSFYGR